MANSDDKHMESERGGFEEEVDPKLLSEVDTGLGKLQDKLSDLKEHLHVPFERIEKLSRDQKQQEMHMEEGIRKSRSLSYFSVTMALLALILSGIIAGVTIRTRTDAAGIQEKIVSLSQDLALLKKGAPASELDEFRDSLAASTLRIDFLDARMEELRQNQKSLAQPDATMQILMQKNILETKSWVADIEEKLHGVEAKLETAETKKQKRDIVPKQLSVWSVNLTSFAKEGYAKLMADRYTQRGVPVQMRKVTVDGKTWYRLYVPDFETKESAEAFAKQAEKDLELGSVWISKN